MPTPESTDASGPLLSVVVPAYDVEEYLDECLSSILDGGWDHLEVVVVDDGSSDDSLAVAEAFARRDTRVTVHSFPNGGLGAARNRGAAFATGEYLMFVDSDDVIVPGSLARLVDALEETGSDFAAGNVRRLRGMTELPSPPHEMALARRRLLTRLADDPVLVQDTTAWNKVFRTSFWRTQSLRWGEGVLYEDMATVARAYAAARAVDVVGAPTYVWRYRDSGVSITQRRSETRNLVDRLAALAGSFEAFGSAGPAVLDAFAEKVLTLDLWLYISVALDGNEEFRAVLTAAVDRWLREASSQVVSRLPVRRRAQLELARAGRFTEATAVDAWFADLRDEPPTDVVDGTAVVRIPPSLTPGGALPASVLAHARAAYEVALARVRVENDVLVLTGWSTVPTNPPLGGTSLILRSPSAWDERATRRRWLAPLARLARRTQLRVALARADVPDAPTVPTAHGFQARVPIADLRAAADGRDRSWALTVDGRSVVARGAVPRSTAELIAPNLLIQTAAAAGRAVELRTTFPRVRATAVNWSGSVATVEIASDVPVRGAQAFVEHRATPLAIDTASGGTAVFIDVPSGAARCAVRVETASGTVPVVWAVAGAELVVGATGAAARADRRGNLVVDPPMLALEADDFTVLDGPVLHVAGTGRGPIDETSVRLEPLTDGPVNAARHAVRLRGARFEVDVALTEPGADGALRPLAAGRRWRLGWSSAAGSGVVTLSPRAAARLPYRHGSAQGPVEILRAAGDQLAVRLRPLLAPDEAGRLAQQRPGADDRATTDALNDDALVIQRGDGALESPRAIAAELVRRGDGRVLWAVADGSEAAPQGTELVLVGSTRFQRALREARVLVVDGPLPTGFVGRAGQAVVQSGYGRPLGRLGHQLGSIRPADLARLDRDAAQWTLLLAPGPWATESLRRALGYKGVVAEVGMPGTDALVLGDSAGARARVAAGLGLADGMRLVVWSPVPQGIARLDPGVLARELGDGFVVLASEDRRILRAGTDGVVTTAPIGVVDAALAADVHITNHVSGALDLVLTRGSVHLLGRAATTGTSTEQRALIPAPVVDRHEIAALLRAGSIDAPDWSAFRERLCSEHDGGAAARVVDLVRSIRPV